MSSNTREAGGASPNADSGAKAPVVATYKGVDIYYNKNNGRLQFELEACSDCEKL